VVNEKKERNSRRKAELKHERSTLEKQVQGRDEELEAAQMQLQVGCLHHAMCISSIVTQSNSVCVCVLSVCLLSVLSMNRNASAAVSMSLLCDLHCVSS